MQFIVSILNSTVGSTVNNKLLQSESGWRFFHFCKASLVSFINFSSTIKPLFKNTKIYLIQENMIQLHEKNSVLVLHKLKFPTRQMIYCTIVYQKIFIIKITQS